MGRLCAKVAVITGGASGMGLATVERFVAVGRGIKLAAPRMIERGAGSIISTSSGAGLMGIPGLAAYSAAKGGVVALTRAAAMELASKRVRVNCICPGAIVTPIIYNSPIR